MSSLIPQRLAIYVSRLFLWCENRECLHRARIDLEAIAERYGVELSVAEFVNRSVCSECGARWPNISISLEPVSTRGARIDYSQTVEKKTSPQ
jgi:hypothetical protein